MEKEFLKLPWIQVKEFVAVKLLPQQGELYILALSQGRRQKERALRRRRLKQLWKRLHGLPRQKLSRDDLLLKLGAAKAEAGNAWRLVRVCVPPAGETAGTARPLSGAGVSPAESAELSLAHRKIR